MAWNDWINIDASDLDLPLKNLNYAYANPEYEALMRQASKDYADRTRYLENNLAQKNALINSAFNQYNKAFDTYGGDSPITAKARAKLDLQNIRGGILDDELAKHLASDSPNNPNNPAYQQFLKEQAINQHSPWRKYAIQFGKSVPGRLLGGTLGAVGVINNGMNLMDKDPFSAKWWGNMGGNVAGDAIGGAIGGAGVGALSGSGLLAGAGAGLGAGTAGGLAFGTGYGVGTLIDQTPRVWGGKPISTHIANTLWDWLH